MKVFDITLLISLKLRADATQPLKQRVGLELRLRAGWGGNSGAFRDQGFRDLGFEALSNDLSAVG